MRFGFDTLIFKHILDISLSCLMLRIVLGWLVAYPRLLQLLLTVLLLGIAAVLIVMLKLPLSSLLILLAVLPVAVFLFLSFLPELSRLYQAASRGNLLRPRVFQSEQTMGQVAMTLVDLIRERRGALFVFPGRQGVEDLISGGEEVDAAVNRSILLSIFNPNCPRHDGAAVILGNRIVRVGGVLPLASAEGADADLGTRHLAAIGLTQRSDAHVLVVSEQRGVISHARNGSLRQVTSQTVEDLEEELMLLLGMRHESHAKKRNRILSVGLWVFALMLALSGSFSAEHYRKKYFETPTDSTTAEAKIDFTNIPPKLYVADLSPKTATLYLRTPKALSIGRSYTVQVDLRNARAGRTSLNLAEDFIQNLPREARVEKFEPSTIYYTLAEMRMLRLQIALPECSGLKHGLRIKEHRIEPDVVQAVVRDGEWKTTDRIKTLPADASFITQPGIYSLDVTLNPPQSVQIVGPGSTGKVRLVLEVALKKAGD